MTEIEVRPLRRGDEENLSRLLLSQHPDYLIDFHPFAFDVATLGKILGSARRDRFWGFDSDGRLIGFFMLRGFDAGYDIPSFGVFVAEDASRRGLARRALAHAEAWCVSKGIAKMMLKVAEDNSAAIRLYQEQGFEPVGLCDRTGHIVHYRTIKHPESC